MRTPLYDWHVAQGARMVDFAGWEMPIQYTTIGGEHLAVRVSAGLFDVSHMGRLVFEGTDALDLIQHVFTNDAADLKPGQVRYGLVCNEDGGIRDDVLVYRLESLWMMVVNASNREKILSWLAQQRGPRHVEVKDRTADWAMIAVQGPRAVDVVSATLTSGVWPSTTRLMVRNLSYYHALRVPEQVGRGLEGVISRTGYTGEDGFELIVPASLAVPVAQGL